MERRTDQRVLDAIGIYSGTYAFVLEPLYHVFCPLSRKKADDCTDVSFASPGQTFTIREKQEEQAFFHTRNFLLQRISRAGHMVYIFL